MIPSIRKRIDEANNAHEIGDGDHGHWIRINIPPSDLAILSDLRRGEHSQRARENIALILREIDAENRGNLNQDCPVDDQRSFGLSLGEDIRKIWEQILERVKGLKDIVQIRETCRLFREILDEKYKSFRFNEVISKFPNRLGGMKTLLNLRKVCRSIKATVDALLLENQLDPFWNAETFFDALSSDKWIWKPELRVAPNPNEVRHLELVVRKLEQQGLPNDAFHFRDICLGEYAGGDLNNPIVPITGRERDHPLLLDLRNQFQRFLELVGGSIRSFVYSSCGDNLFIYDQLRTWIPLMPNLEYLTVSGMNHDDDTMTLDNPSAFQPFPSCVRFKRYKHQGSGFCAPFVAEIFRANPWITDVNLSWDITMEDMDEAELGALQNTLNILKMERFHVYGVNTVPPLQFEFRFDWPLKDLSLTMEDWEEETREAIPSRTLFKFINTFTKTLEELTVTWKIHDTGGYLDLPKVNKLLWKFWPDFLDFDFMVAMENLQFLDMDVSRCEEINGSYETVKKFIVEEKNLLVLFPALRKIRARIEPQALAEWLHLW